MLSFLTSHRAQLHCAFSGRSKGPHRAPPRAVTSTADRPRNLDRFAAPTSAAANVAPTVRAKRSGKAMICHNCAWDSNHSFIFGCTHDGSWLKLLSNCKKMKIRENMPYVPFYHSTHGSLDVFGGSPNPNPPSMVSWWILARNFTHVMWVWGSLCSIRRNVSRWDMAVCQNLVPLVNIKWMFIPLKIVFIGIDPLPYNYNITITMYNSLS